jgi:hypothetical protein
MNNFLRTTTFYSNDRDPHDLPVGEGLYIWHVEGMERVEGRTSPALRVNITMDEDAMAAAKLDAFFTDVWLEPGLSQPSKTHAYVKGRQDGNRFTLDLTEALDSVTLGTEEVSDGCGANHSYTVEGENPDDWYTLDKVPERGGVGGGFDFSPEEAYQWARSDDTQFDYYLDNHPDAFCHLGNYSEVGGEARWALAFGQGGSSEHSRIVVVDQDPPTRDLNVDKVEDFTDDTSPLSSRASIGKVVTLSRGMRLMREQSEIRNRCFVDNDPDWTRFTFNITETVSAISLDPVSFLAGSTEGGYIYLLVSKSDDYQAALDATNGQVLFSRTHTEDFDGLRGVG